MSYDIRLVKLVTGEIVIGKYDAEKKCITDAGLLQILPTQNGIQMLLTRFYNLYTAFGLRTENT